jgi:hypothetical protein
MLELNSNSGGKTHASGKKISYTIILTPCHMQKQNIGVSTGYCYCWFVTVLLFWFSSFIFLLLFPFPVITPSMHHPSPLALYPICFGNSGESADALGIAPGSSASSNAAPSPPSYPLNSLPVLWCWPGSHYKRISRVMHTSGASLRVYPLSIVSSRCSLQHRINTGPRRYGHYGWNAVCLRLWLHRQHFRYVNDLRYTAWLSTCISHITVWSVRFGSVRFNQYVDIYYNRNSNQFFTLLT